MKHFAAAAAIATALTLGTAAIGAAQTTAHAMNAAPAHHMAATHHAAPAHRGTSRISESKARHAALGAVAHGRVQSHRLEHQNGKLVYVYHITVPGQHGWEKVTVDATSGAVISNEHQAPATTTTHHVTHTTHTTHHKR